MAQITPPGIGDIGADPFFERSPYPFAMVKTILGARFRFDSTHAALLEPVEAAYGGLPHDVPGAQLPAFHVELRLSPRRLAAVRDEPPPVLTQSTTRINGRSWWCPKTCSTGPITCATS